MITTVAQGLLIIYSCAAAAAFVQGKRGENDTISVLD